MMAGRVWEAWETALAVECETMADFTRVAKEIGRTAFAVSDRRYLMRPADVRRWTESEDAILATLRTDRKCRPGEIRAIMERLPGRSAKAINERRKLLRQKGRLPKVSPA